MESGKLLTEKPRIQERTLDFSVQLIEFSTLIPRNSIGLVLIKQIVRSGTSIGSNIQEAQDASSKKDFIQKMSIALREAKETQYWLNVIIRARLVRENLCTRIFRELNEITAILTTIIKRSKVF